MARSEKMNAVDGPGATLAVARAVSETVEVKGHYKASLMRVDDEYQEEAKTLAQLINETVAEAEVARLVARLQALPRHEVWVDEIYNVVTTVGKNLSLDTILAGSGYTAAVVMGLKGTGSAVAADTMASHASWLEVGLANAPAYSGNRPTPSFNSAAAGVKATSAAVAFTFTSGGTVAGCFIVLAGSATKDNTTGTLLSAGDFSGGNKTVANTDVLNVTYSLAL
jgi:hypothetical protein